MFTWYFGKYNNKIAHSESCLPEFDIQSGFSNFAVFSRWWDKYHEIPCLNFPLPPYLQDRIKEDESQWVVLS